MSETTSNPVVPAQPNKAQYGIGELELFKKFMSREAYEEAFGIPAPAYNPDLRPKYWKDDSVDLSDPEAEVEYLVPKIVGGVWRLVRTMMPNWEAAACNIPDTLPSGVTPSNPEWEGRGRPMREFPVRPLLANEALYSGFGNTCMVGRTDLLAKQEQESGKFLASDRVLLQAIAAKLNVAI